MTYIPPQISPIDPVPGPVVAVSGGLNTQLESPLLIVRQRDIYSEVNQQRFHDETLQWYGEECIVRTLIRVEDVVASPTHYFYCTDCQDSPDPSSPNSNIQNRVSQVYRQSGNSYCPTCYGTTFYYRATSSGTKVGGFKPTCYHLYMLASDTPDVRKNLSTGQFWQENPSVQFSWYPQIRVGDLVVRVTTWSGTSPSVLDGRYQVNAVGVQTVRTGPGPSNDTTKIVSQTCTLETLWPSHPYYSIPVA